MPKDSNEKLIESIEIVTPDVFPEEEDFDEEWYEEPEEPDD